MANPWPKLSETLPQPRHPNTCQACGMTRAQGAALDVWAEYDDHDKTKIALVVLCRACSKKIIEPHPRLYQLLPQNAPLPGAMHLCVDCRHREGVRCTHAKLKDNGGPGLKITPGPSSSAIVCGGRRGCQGVTIYTEPPKDCEGMEVEW